MTKRDYYEVLGVSRSATEDELKRAFRKAAIECHPDKNPGNMAAEDRFKELNEAYQVLSDSSRRSSYDRFGHAAFAGGGFDPGFSASSFTDIFDNIFGDIFGSAASSASGGVDLRYNLEISFEEAAFGADREIVFDKAVACENCKGTGAKPGTQPKTCSQCRGSGQIRLNQGFFTLARTCVGCMGRGTVIEERCTSCRGKARTQRSHTLTVKIPPGVDSGQRMRLRGEGEVGESGNRPGDLFVVIHVQDHLVFRREQETVLLDMPISFVQAALGADIDVPTLAGSTTLKIPAGTQSGESFRLKGKGIKRLNGSGHGDQHVHIVVETPTRLTQKQKEVLREFEKHASDDSHPAVTSFLNKLKKLL